MIERVRYFAGLFNWGDDINPKLYTMLTGNEPVKMHVLDESKVDHLMMCGSILNFANEYTTVWGAGFMNKQSGINGVPKKVCAVRGPLTAQRLEELGIEVSVPYGDPSLLIGRYWCLDPMPPNYKYGVIPHYVDKLLVKDWPDDILRIDIQRDTTKILEDISQCDVIMSSSLHGLILADAFNKTALWIKLSNNLSGDDMKFHDYFASIGRKDVTFFDLRGGYTDEVKNAFKPYDVKIDLDALYEACPLIN
jgi:pyruvyltransferase